MSDAIERAVFLQNKEWAEEVAWRTAIVENQIAQSRQAVLNARDAKNAELDNMEEMIRWAITSIYNYDEQNELN